MLLDELNALYPINPAALRKTKIVYNFGLSECNKVKCFIFSLGISKIIFVD